LNEAESGGSRGHEEDDSLAALRCRATIAVTGGKPIL
jgi:hypothetical protein